VRRSYAYRLHVTLPEGSDEYGWEPEGWADLCAARGWYEPDHSVEGPPPFAWPRRKLYFSKSGADTRAELLRTYGATVEVKRSLPIMWPEDAVASDDGTSITIPGQGKIVVEDGVTKLLFDDEHGNPAPGEQP
jgi:hypothetical protein